MNGYGPRGNCGCCKKVHKCVCEGESVKYPAFINTPTIEVEISDMPNTVTWDSLTYPLPDRYRISTLSGMAAMNGTYFFPYSNNDGCIDYGPYTGSVEISLLYEWEETTFTSSTCVLGTTTSGSGNCTLLLNPIVVSPSMFDISLSITGNTGGRNGHIQIRNRKRAYCIEGWDYKKTTGTESYGGPLVPAQPNSFSMSNTFQLSDPTIVMCRSYKNDMCSWTADTGNTLGVPNYGPGYHPFGTMELWMRDI